MGILAMVTGTGASMINAIIASMMLEVVLIDQTIRTGASNTVVATTGGMTRMARTGKERANTEVDETMVMMTGDMKSLRKGARIPKVEGELERMARMAETEKVEKVAKTVRMVHQDRGTSLV